MLASRTLRCTLVVSALCGILANDARADSDGVAQVDRKILEQAGNAMVFQVVFADMALALSKNEQVIDLAQHIHDLSRRGLRHIESMAADCGFKLEAHLDAPAWRRIGALREIATPHLRDQVWVDAQLMRLYEAREENSSAASHAQDEIVQAFAQRSEPEIESLILRVRAVAANL